MQNWLQKSFLLGLVTIEVCVVAGFWMWTEDARAQHSAQYEKQLVLIERRDTLESEISGQLAYRDAITQDRLYLEQVAREKLGYAGPNEFIFLIPESESSGFEEIE